MKVRLINKHINKCRAGKNPFVLGEHKYSGTKGIYAFICNDPECEAYIEVADYIIDNFVSKLAKELLKKN